MLNEIRFGELSQRSIARFRSLSRNIDYQDGIEPTQLCVEYTLSPPYLPSFVLFGSPCATDLHHFTAFLVGKTSITRTVYVWLASKEIIKHITRKTLVVLAMDSAKNFSINS